MTRPNRNSTKLRVWIVMLTCAVINIFGFGGKAYASAPGDMPAVEIASPSNVRAADAGKAGVKISWDSVKTAEHYVVYRSTKKDSGYAKLAEVKKTSYTDAKVKSARVFYYKVVSVNGTASSEESQLAAVYLTPGTPKVKKSFKNNAIKLSWGKITGADTYYIYKKNSKGKYKKIAQTSKLSYNDKKVEAAECYYYKVMAVYKRDGKTVKGKYSKVCKAWADNVDPKKKMVALTFDDGPGKYTKTIVKCLKKNNAKATFFVLGGNVSAYPSSVKAAYKAGCQIGNHTYGHPDLTRLSTKEIKSQISKTDKAVKAITGSATTIMRTPGGSVNSTVKKAVGKPIILWSIDTRDWEHRNTNKTIQCVMNNVKDGDIVLMHDIHAPTKDAALYLIPKLKKKGYQLVTVKELAAHRGHTLKKGSVYNSLRKK